jgi:hypothetical protein
MRRMRTWRRRRSVSASRPTQTAITPAPAAIRPHDVRAGVAAAGSGATRKTSSTRASRSGPVPRSFAADDEK